MASKKSGKKSMSVGNGPSVVESHDNSLEIEQSQGESFQCLSSNSVDLIREFIPHIRRMAAIFASRNPSSLDIEDLTSAGVIGLIGALARYDPSREIKFRTFAEYRIRGMMLDEMRAMDWIPRSVRSRYDQIKQAHTAFVQREGRSPGRDDIAEILGVTREELDTPFLRELQLVSLDDPLSSEEEAYTLKDVLPDSEQPDPLTSCMSSQKNQALMTALHDLSSRQQEILRWYYFNGLTMKEIGLRLGLTESGVCRIHGEALRKLRGELQEFEDPDCTKPKERATKLRSVR